MRQINFVPLKKFVAGAALLALSACAPIVAPPGPVATTPVFSGDAFVTSDGLRLPARLWLPVDNRNRKFKAVVLAVHGFNDYSKAFDKVPGASGVGPFLAENGIAVYAYDQRGFGNAPHFGLWSGGDVMARDFADFVRLLKNMHPDAPIYALGESMGGAVVMTALASQDPPPVDAAILAAPAVWARSTMPMPYRVALWIGARVAPGLKPSGRSFGRMASDNIEMLRDNSRDPLFIKETRIDAVYGLSNLMDEALAAPPKIDVPVLYLYGQNDQIIPKGPTVQAVALFQSAEKEVRTAYYESGWHMILRDKESKMVLRDVVAFIEDMSASLPSGADQNSLQRLRANGE
jgi:acylglycerol lipase